MKPKPPAASNSAAMVLLGCDLAADDPELRPLVPGETRQLARFLLETAPPSRWLTAAARQPAGRRALRTMFDRINPGILPHYVVRKHWLEETAAQALTGEATGVLILAAGFDALGLRLARRFPASRVVETDMPGTLTAKCALLAQLGTLPPNLAFSPLDLTAPEMTAAPRALLAGADLEALLIIAEGITMYLDPTVNARLFQALLTLAPTVQVAFTFLNIAPGSGQPSPRALRWLRQRGEPVRWTPNLAELRALLTGLGYEIEECVTASELATRAGLPARFTRAAEAQAEMVCLARAGGAPAGAG